jgi:hypothetical protein
LVAAGPEEKTAPALAEQEGIFHQSKENKVPGIVPRWHRLVFR